MLLAEPSPEDLLEALETALARVHLLDPVEQHKRVGGRNPAQLLCAAGMWLPVVN